MSATVKTAFLVPFFGPLPPYFHFWAKSCEPNRDRFHWFVYNDHLNRRKRLNPAVTLIPYQFDEMKAAFADKLGIVLPGRHLRRVCDYRLLFYFIRRAEESLDDFGFIGYTDMDMVYGRLKDFLPENMGQYAMISADDDAPCGPFTLMNRHQLHRLGAWKHLKAEMEKVCHESFNENRLLMRIIGRDLPVWCRADALQPQMCQGMNHRHHFGIWDNGRVMVRDCWQRTREGGFYHFSRYKNRDRFNITPAAVHSGQWCIHKFGISEPDAPWATVKRFASLYI